MKDIFNKMCKYMHENWNLVFDVILWKREENWLRSVFSPPHGERKKGKPWMEMDPEIKKGMVHRWSEMKWEIKRETPSISRTRSISSRAPLNSLKTQDMPQAPLTTSVKRRESPDPPSTISSKIEFSVSSSSFDFLDQDY